MLFEIIGRCQIAKRCQNGNSRIRSGQHEGTDDGEPAPGLEAAGYPIDYWHADEGLSGKVSAAQRPQFAKMLGQIREAKPW